MVYDVIVSGVGPAGVGFLKGIEGSGLKVLAFDRESFPRKKPCAGGLTPKCYFLLKGFFPLLDKLVKVSSSTFHLFNGKEEVFLNSPFPLTYLTDREELDLFLFEEISKVWDVHLKEEVLDASFEGELVRVRTNKDTYLCRVLIAADGVNSKLSRKFNLDRDLGFTFEGDFKMSLGNKIVLDFSGFKWGYYWIFPKGDYVTAGLGEFKNFNNLRKLFSELNRKHGVAGKKLWERGFPIPAGRRKNDVVRKRVIFLGDAGGLADPLTGEGIYYAFKSGLIGGEVVKKVFEKGNFTYLNLYKELVDKVMGREFFWARVVGRLFFNFKSLNFYFVKNYEGVAQLTLKLLSGEISYKDGVAKFLTYLPKLLLR